MSDQSLSKVVKVRKALGRLGNKLYRKTQRVLRNILEYIKSEIDEYRNYVVPHLSRYSMSEGRIPFIVLLAPEELSENSRQVEVLLETLEHKDKIKFAVARHDRIRKTVLEKCDIVLAAHNLSDKEIEFVNSARMHGKLTAFFDEQSLSEVSVVSSPSDYMFAYDIVYTFSPDASAFLQNANRTAVLLSRPAFAADAKKSVREQFLRQLAETFLQNIVAILPQYNVLVIGAPIATLLIDIVLPFKYLKKRNFLNFRARTLLHVKLGEISHYDFIIISREVEPKAARIIRNAHLCGKKVLYSWDDNFFDIPAELGKTAEYYLDKSRIKALKTILKTADCVKASTRYLAEISRKYSKKVLMQYYTYDFAVINGVIPDKKGSNEIRIGFFGNPGREKEFEFVFSALLRLDCEYKNLVFEFFGHVPAGAEKLKKVTIIEPESDYISALRKFARRRWDVGLAPMLETPFNKAKGPTKYRDYAACNVAGVYSEGEVFSAFVKNKSNGMLVENTEESWYRALKFLVEKKASREKIAARAFKDVHDNYNALAAADEWEKIIRKETRR